MHKKYQPVQTILVGGAAGDGVHESSLLLARLLGSIGYHFYVGLDYQSLIRGGHNFCRVSFARDEVWCDHRDLDFLIALNESSVAKHLSELNKEAVILDERFNGRGGDSD